MDILGAVIILSGLAWICLRVIGKLRAGRKAKAKFDRKYAELKDK